LETKMGLIFECFKGRKTSDLLFFLRRQGMWKSVFKVKKLRLSIFFNLIRDLNFTTCCVYEAQYIMLSLFWNALNILLPLQRATFNKNLSCFKRINVVWQYAYIHNNKELLFFNYIEIELHDIYL
jgi:hypothetical protein